MSEYSLTQIAPTIAAILDLPAPKAATAPVLSEIADEVGHAERLAVLAPDALGMHPFGIWRHEMPYLSALYDRRGIVLRGVMPTITPVNFATIISGATPDVHGIQNFKMDFQCESLFDVVRAHGNKSAGVGRKGYTGSELLGRFADYWGTAHSKTDDEVEEIALQFASQHQPQFMIVQFGATDELFHRHGPSSPELRPVVREMDERLRRTVAELQSRGYAIIITADHGQHDVEGRGSHGSDADEDALVPGTWLKAE